MMTNDSVDDSTKTNGKVNNKVVVDDVDVENETLTMQANDDVHNLKNEMTRRRDRRINNDE